MDQQQPQTSQVDGHSSSVSTELRSPKGREALVKLLIMLQKLQLRSVGSIMSQPMMYLEVQREIMRRAIQELTAHMNRELYLSQTPNSRLNGLQESLDARSGISYHTSSSSRTLIED